jgi:hypothetical protein
MTRSQTAMPARSPSAASSSARLVPSARASSHDDEVDACSGALEMLNPHMNSEGLFEFYRREAEKLRAEREAASGRPEPTWAPGSMEWRAQQNKSS